MHMPRRADVVVSTRQPAVLDIPVARRGAIHGFVEDGTHEAMLEGVTVRLYGADGAGLGAATTDFEGEYRFEGLRAGTYRVRVDAPPSYSAAPTEATVQVTAHSETAADFELRLSGTVRGRVVDEDTGEPLPNLEVVVYDSQGRTVRRGTTGPAGEYEFDQLPEDKYTVEVLG